MQIYLAKNVQVPLGAAVNQVIYMEHSTSDDNDNIYVRKNNSFPVQLTPVDVSQENEIRKLDQKLGGISSRSGGGSQVQGHTSGSWQLTITVGVYAPPTHTNFANIRRTSISSDIKGFISVTDGIQSGSTGILGRLSQVYGLGNVKLTVMIENIKTRYQSSNNEHSVWTRLMKFAGGENVMYIDPLNSYGAENSGLDICGEGSVTLNDWIYYFYQNGNNLKWEASITITAHVPDRRPEIGLCVPDKLCISKKLLLEGVCADTTIIAKNGVRFNCHKAVLAVQSSILGTIFRVQPQTITVEMLDMSEDSVRALLSFLYCWETKEAENNSLICVELLMAGNKYDFSQLENCMQEILLTKNSDWFDVDVAVKLFLYSRNLSNGNELKMKSVDVMKSKPAVLEKCTSYQQLFKEDAEAAMELCNILVRCQNN